MPTKQVTVCASCESPKCDGAMWIWVRITGNEDPDVGVDMANIPDENKGPKCSHSFRGNGRINRLKDKKVGDEVTLDYPNWHPPSRLTVRKVED